MISLFYNVIYLKIMVSMIYTVDTVCKSTREDCPVMNICKLFYTVFSKGRAEKQLGLVS